MFKQWMTKGSLQLLSEPAFSRLVGKIAQADNVPRGLLRAVIKRYVDFYGVDLSEIAEPLESFASFDDFFTRALKPGVHTIDPDPGVAVSPVDGRILNMGRVSGGRIDQVKGRSYLLEELLDSKDHSRRFESGHYITIYLSPKDYHRIHCPVAGKVTGYRYIPGRLYPVNNMGVTNVDKLFAVNERLVSFVKSSLGEVAVVKVGATNVGMITASYHDVCTNVGRRTAYDESLRKSAPIDKGGELGRFHLGSTVVLVTANENLIPVSLQPEDYVRMGQPLLRLK
ncbi:MAG: phosphatidylserine decarboxylase [Myxococcota bacterium]|jgi:phosphatidylserine decarboxylase